jgi:DNA-binding winged helix-turn-helix (wHTH) protein
MISKRVWKTYPITYRAREMALLAEWIQRGESGSIVGLPGAGKSNLLGFLSHRPELIQQYLPDTFPRLALVHVDLNNLPSTDLATFFRVILRSFYEAWAQLAHLEPSLPPAIEMLYRKAEDKIDPFLVQSALREVLFLFEEKGIRVVLVLDPFDQFCRIAPTQVLDTLRGLRDSFKAILSYLMGLRQEVGYIRNPFELGELYEIMDTYLCWLGAMDREDARWIIGQVETVSGQSFTEAQVDQLIELTGGYAALLRAASHWLANSSPVPEMSVWEERLFAEPDIQNRLIDLRQGLTGEEEAALSALQLALMLNSTKERQASLRQIGEKYQQVLTRLQRKRLCRSTEAGWTLFSPLFARFVAQMEGVSAGKIRCDSTSDRFFLGEQELTGLSEKDRRLLRYFLDHPRTAHTVDDLIEAAWPEDFSDGVSDEAVQQAIRHLRQQLEPNPAKPCYLVTERGAGYRFFPEGAPRW